MRVSVKTIHQFGIDVMKAAGLDDYEAEHLSHSLIFADLRGVGSHGFSRLSTYAKRVECGVIANHVRVEILNDSPSAIVIDGKNGIGASVAMQAMNLCVERAKVSGCCFATVRNANHFGVGAYYSRVAMESGCASVIVANGEVGVVPTGGATPMLGTNPVTVGLPTGDGYPPIMLDMATSAVARGKVVLAQKEGRSIPLGWGVDRNGNPTTNPEDILNGGSMSPMAGPKGYGMALIIDMLCSAMGGSLNCRNTPSFWYDFEHPQNIGYFMGAFDVNQFMPYDTYLNRIDDIIDEFKNAPKAEGVSEIMMPGEIEHNKFHANYQPGVEYGDVVLEELRSIGKHFSVPCGF
ncbi:Ldh family oxidoreductase [Muriventricola aceti]|uniref:Ldh family oxidoreductase n=1 Tax=Muriventricola aceti TaxID=2981773 RepID=UPI0008227A23|nr:Ldh family oxidoreductase [Muriventricola aceti]MCU6701487.1 Ldh family oxidoreductase [Muriventricola aceti]SCI62331.1 Ureidoglycolate dehydrogenase [uncultured Flavonifractor sp.]